MQGRADIHSSEIELMLDYLEQQRDTIVNAVCGLTDEQVARRPTPHGLSLVSLIQHVIDIERHWIGLATSPGCASDVERAVDRGAAPVSGGDSIADLVARYRALAASTEQAVRAVGDLDRLVPVKSGVSWLRDDVEKGSVRSILLHMLEEVRRHAGHADFLRESIDGASNHQWLKNQWMVTV